MTEEPESLGAEILAEMRQHRLETATRVYDQIINRLWAGNGAGTLATLAAIGGGKPSGATVFVALCMFVLGLVLLAIAAVYSIIVLTPIIRNLEGARSILDIRVDHIRRPSEEIGLSIKDCRTVINFLSAILFLMGAVFGLLAAARVVGLSI